MFACFKELSVCLPTSHTCQVSTLTCFDPDTHAPSGETQPLLPSANTPLNYAAVKSTPMAFISKMMLIKLLSAAAWSLEY